MSTLMEDDIKRWTTKRKTAMVLDIIFAAYAAVIKGAITARLL